MGDFPLPQEILEHILQYVDGKTLLTCKEVSPKFAAAVNYLSKAKDIWRECYFKEKYETHPFAVISKLHPHEEGFNHLKNWSFIYELVSFKRTIPSAGDICFSKLKIGKRESVIEDVRTHGDLILILVKYNKDFSIFNRILTINLTGVIIGKSIRFYEDAMFVTAVESLSNVRPDAVTLNCDSCKLIAVPIISNHDKNGYPIFKKGINFMTVKHSNGDILGFNCKAGLIDKGDCFHVGNESMHNEMKHNSKFFKIEQSFTGLHIFYDETHREFSTFQKLRARVTATKHYSNLLILGTDTGTLYMYNLYDESDLKLLNLQYYLWHFDVCCNPILAIDVMELVDQFVVVCCSAEYLYQVCISRSLKSVT